MGRPRTTRTSDQVTIRLPEGMREEINRLAAENGRSANAEIVARLSKSMSQARSSEVDIICEHVDRSLALAVKAIVESR